MHLFQGTEVQPATEVRQADAEPALTFAVVDHDVPTRSRNHLRDLLFARMIVT